MALLCSLPANAQSHEVFPSSGFVAVHGLPVLDIAYSPDGTLVATGGDLTLNIHDAATWDQVAALEGHTQKVWAVAWSPDGSLLASASADTWARIWDVNSQTELAAFRSRSGGMLSVAFSPDGKSVAFGSYRVIYLWDVETQSEIGLLEGHTNDVWDVAFSADGKRLASASGDFSVRIWDLESRTELAELRGHTAAASSIAFGIRDTTLVSGSTDGSVRLWDTEFGVPLTALKPEDFRYHEASIRDIALDSNGALLATANSDGTVRIWDLGFESQIAAFTTIFGLHAVALSPDGKTLTAGTGSGRLYWWDIGPYREATIINADEQVDAIDFSPDGQILAYSSSSGLFLWDIDRGQGSQLTRRGGYSITLRFSPAGDLLVTGDGFWDPHALVELDYRSIFANAIAFSPDGTILAIAVAFTEEDEVLLWDPATREQIGVLLGHESDLGSIAFSPDGAMLITAGGLDRTVRVWDVRERQQIAMRSFSVSTRQAALSPGGELLAVGFSSREDVPIRLYSFPSMEHLVDLPSRPTIYRLAFHPGGRLLAASGSDGVIRIWDVLAHEEIATFRGFWVDRRNHHIAFSPDGHAFAAGSSFGSVLLWRDLPLPAEPTAVEEDREMESVLPTHAVLFSAYPNPFNEATVIEYQLPETTVVHLALFNLLGQEVRVLADGLHRPGLHNVSWDGRSAAGRPAATGVYVARLQTEVATLAEKLLLLR